MKLFIRKLSLVICLLAVFNPLAVAAIEIDYNNLLSDAEAEDYNSMGQLDIKNFLQSKNSYLVTYWYAGNNPAPSEITTDPELEHIKLRSAAEIIYNASQEAKINPKFLLTMLQKEQSLIEDPAPDDRALGFAMGYYCYDGQACNPKWKGFGKQVRATALQFRDYLDNIESRPYQPGKASTIDGTKVIPENKITAAMYVYTPHLHGNSLFATLWDRYGFSGVSNKHGIFPDGSLVRAKDGDDTKSVYLIYAGQRRLFSDTTALISRYDPKKILTVSAEELDKFADGHAIEFANYSVLQSPTGEKYLIDGLVKRAITSDEAFRLLGYNPDEITSVSDQELSQIENGLLLQADTVSPIAKLLRDTSTNGVFYVKDGSKAPIVDPSILKINFSKYAITDASTKTLEPYVQTLPVKIEDGNLVKIADDPRVYVISNGQRRAIPDESVFLGLGYQWSNILTIPERVMKLHTIGEPLSL